MGVEAKKNKKRNNKKTKQTPKKTAPRAMQLWMSCVLHDVSADRCTSPIYTVALNNTRARCCLQGRVTLFSVQGVAHAIPFPCSAYYQTRRKHSITGMQSTQFYKCMQLLQQLRRRFRITTTCALLLGPLKRKVAELFLHLLLPKAHLEG